MMKFITILILILGSIPLYSAEVSSDLKKAVDMIMDFPEGKKVLEQVERNGKVRICSSRLNSPVDSMWDAANRSIVINSNYLSNLVLTVQLILFEWHNALADNDYSKIHRLAGCKSISKDNYVTAIEHLIYENLVKTCSIVEGYFPSDFRCSIPSSFEEYLDAARKIGHTESYARLYDYIIAHPSSNSSVIYLP